MGIYEDDDFIIEGSLFFCLSKKVLSTSKLNISFKIFNNSFSVFPLYGILQNINLYIIILIFYKSHL